MRSTLANSRSRVTKKNSVRVYQNDEYGGANLEFWTENPGMTYVYGVPNFHDKYIEKSWWVDKSWGDQIDSVKTSPEWQATLFEHGSYTGNSVVLWPRQNYADLGSFGWGDKVSSAKFKRFDGVIMYSHTEFRGDKVWAWCGGRTPTTCGVTFMNDWNDRISSLSVGGCTRITLYKDANYQGESLTLAGESHWPSFVSMGVNDVYSSYTIERLCNVA